MGFQSRASIEKQEEITMKISIKITALLVALNISLTMSSPRGFDFKKVDGWFQFEDGVWTRVNDPDSKTVTTSDKQALDLYRLGWATGDVEIILSSINKTTFTFTWVPDDNAVSPRDFPEFFKTFMKNAEKASNKKYFMALTTSSTERLTAPCTRQQIGLWKDLVVGRISTQPRTAGSPGTWQPSLSLARTEQIGSLLCLYTVYLYT